MYFIVMNYATFPYDFQTHIIIPIQVAQWIASWTSGVPVLQERTSDSREFVSLADNRKVLILGFLIHQNVSVYEHLYKHLSIFSFLTLYISFAFYLLIHFLFDITII